MDYICPDRQCFVEHKLESRCIAYQIDSQPNCSIPCALEYCNFTILNEVVCPIYHCVPFQTTTTSDPTTTVMPDPETDTSNIASFVFNGLLTAALLIVCCRFVIKFIKKRKEGEDRINLLDERQRLNPVVRFEILRENENDERHCQASAEIENEQMPGPSNISTAQKFKISFENIFSKY